MTDPSHDLRRFQEIVANHLGIRCEDAKLSHLASVLGRRLADRKQGREQYLATLESERPPHSEITALARELTVGESYFFRHQEQMDALTHVVLPDRAAQRQGSTPLKILSAGCAAGEEAYSIAILARECLACGGNVEIDAVDVNAAALDKARRAAYSAWSLRATPPAVRDRWFRAHGQNYQLAPSIASAVRFEQRNLCDPGEPWPYRNYDIVFCRNVIMYFTADRARKVVERFADTLAPGGYLFLGHAETLRDLSDAFDLINTNGAFYYRRKHGRARAFAPQPRAVQAPAPVAWDEPSAIDWTRHIDEAGRRIEALAKQSLNASRKTEPGSTASVELTPLERALHLVECERFDEAGAVLDAAGDRVTREPETLLIRAVLAVQSGALDRARALCSELMRFTEHRASAYYILALCAEADGNIQAAAEEHENAAGFDPEFAMPHLHLGLLARRTGDAPIAARELAHAALLLRSEDARRISLFGSGFGRAGLIALCESELANLRFSS